MSQNSRSHQDHIIDYLEEIKEKLVNDFQHMINTVGHTANALSDKVSWVGSLSRAAGMTVEKGHDFFQHSYESTRKAARNAWKNFPPLNWFGYGVAALNFIPLIILISFLICTSALVLFVSGAGILLAEGFFLGIGSLFFIPTVAVLTV